MHEAAPSYFISNTIFLTTRVSMRVLFNFKFNTDPTWKVHLPGRSINTRRNVFVKVSPSSPTIPKCV